MVKLTPMIRISNEASGFTALEILLATALIGIVSTVGLPQTDLFAELSDRGDAIAAAAKAQNRVNVKFTELLISGLACEKAADRVSDLAVVSDGRWAGGEVFNGYAVSPRYLERFETVLTLERLEPKADGSVRRFENLVWDEGTKNGPDRSALLGHNFVYQETKPHGFYSSYFHQRISS